MIGKEKNILPDYPRTEHLPYKANTSHGDLVSNMEDAGIVFQSNNVAVEEKIDGSSCGMCLYEGNPIIRNRSHILSKAFIQRRTAAKMQFASVFNWFYENMSKFEVVNEALGFSPGIYGEWMYATHGVSYNKLPALWIPYDVYDWQQNRFLPSKETRKVLTEAGFCMPKLIYSGKVKDYEQLAAYCKEKAEWSNEEREGIYIKVSDENRVTHRFKMVREGFVQGSKWDDSKITRNKLAHN
jgi:ATP-dependent RNA circularization protein (DNA/RNA ligase family)